MALTLTFDENNQIKTRLGLMNSKYRQVVKSYMLQQAKHMESYMKENRPWHDRTGAARAGLSAKLSSSPKNYVQTIQLSHGVPYGVYLEFSMERRFAILEPTMRLEGPKIITGLQDKIGIFVNVKGV